MWSDSVSAALDSAAHLALAQWRQRLGASGLAAMGGAPWLTATVDQHAAVVRDTLAGPDGSVAAADLAAYADGVADTATRRGWSVGELVDGDWSRASWPSIRLLGVCVLAGPIWRGLTAPDEASGR